ncbi:MAG: DnaJ family domain-containing protein [Candidatus Promineifilaceae bacterium]
MAGERQDDDKRSQGEGGQEAGRRSLPPPERWPSALEELIETAVRDGLFDDLPGRGKPLDLRRNPYAAESELAHKLLKDSDFTLAWIAERRSVLARIDALREGLRTAWLRHQREYQAARSELARLALANHWRHRLAAWGEEIRELNQAIADANLKQPGAGLEILKLDLGHEVGRAGGRLELGEG